MPECSAPSEEIIIAIAIRLTVAGPSTRLITSVATEELSETLATSAG
jgi:hypothetical protein